MRRPLHAVALWLGLPAITISGCLGCPTDRPTPLDFAFDDSFADFLASCDEPGAIDIVSGKLQVVGNSALLDLQMDNPSGASSMDTFENYVIEATLYFETGTVAAATTIDGGVVMTQGEGQVSAEWPSATQFHLEFDALTQEGLQHLSVEVRKHDDDPQDPGLVCDEVEASVDENADGDGDETGSDVTSAESGGTPVVFLNFCEVMTADEIEAIIGVPVELINMKDDDEHTRCWVESTDPTRSYQAVVETQYVQNWPGVLEAFREMYSDAIQIRAQSWAVEGELRLREFTFEQSHVAGLRALAISPGALVSFTATTSDDTDQGITGIGPDLVVSSTESMSETLAQAMIDASN